MSVIRTVLILISFVVFTSAWIYISSNLSIHIKRIMLGGVPKMGASVLAFAIWFVIELMLALCLIPLKAIGSVNQIDFADPVRNWLRTGIDYSVLVSPASTMIGTVSGLKSNGIPPRRI